MDEKKKKTTTPKKPSKTATRTAAKKKSAPVKEPHMMVSREEIARLAHKFWAERGQQDGHHEEDWFRAEQELLGKAS
jgi:hypothetical protein